MTDQSKSSKSKFVQILLFVIIFLPIGILLFLIDYRAFLLLLLAAILGPVSAGLYSLIIGDVELPAWVLPLLPIIAIVMLCLLVFSNFEFMSFFSHYPDDPGFAVNVVAYEAQIEPVDFATGRFGIREQISISCNETRCEDYFREQSMLINEPIAVQLRRQDATGQSIGLILSEVTITPLSIQDTGSFSTSLNDRTRIYGNLCSRSRPTASVVLLDMPRNSFYGAAPALGARSEPYLLTETYYWEVPDVCRGISFLYFRDPYYSFAPLLKPVVELFYSNRNAWVVGSVFILATISLAYRYREGIKAARGLLQRSEPKEEKSDAAITSAPKDTPNKEGGRSTKKDQEE